jgi:hypothetical protein
VSNGDSIGCCRPDWLIARSTGCCALSPKHFTNQAKSLYQTRMVAIFLCGYVEEKSFLWWSVLGLAVLWAKRQRESGQGLWLWLCEKKRHIPCVQNWLLGAFPKLRKARMSFVMPVCRPSAWNNSVHIGRIFMKFDIWIFMDKLWREFKFP